MPFAREMKMKGCKTIVAPFIIGANGTWHPPNGKLLREIGVPKEWLSKFRKYCATDAIRGSRDIFVHFMTGQTQYEGKYANNDPHVKDNPDHWTPDYTLPDIANP